jgi:hypothetical protein
LLSGGYTTPEDGAICNQWSAGYIPTQNRFEPSGDEKETPVCAGKIIRVIQNEAIP